MFNRFSKKTIFVLFSLFLLFTGSSKSVAAITPSQSNDVANLYTLMPMFLPQAPGGLNYEDLLLAMIKDQGYEAHCAGVQWVIPKKLFGDVNKFFSSGTPPEQSFYNGLNPTIFHDVNDYVADMSKAHIPLMRGLEPKTETIKNSSFEGMFGANYQVGADNYLLNSSGVSKRLLSTYQQCLAKTQNIVAAKKICDEVTNEECTLNKKYNFKIAVDENGASRAVSDAEAALIKSNEHLENLDFKINDLLGWFQNIRPELSGTELYQQVCFDITGGDINNTSSNYAPPKVSSDEIAKTREAVNRVPIDLDTLYRLAFLVLVPMQDKGKYDDGDKFYWLQENPQIDAFVHAPLFVAFKIPEFATNKSVAAGNIDSLELAKMAIQTKEQNDKDVVDQKTRRDLLYTLAQTQPDPVIHCPYPKCTKPVEKTLISIINAASVRCKNETLRIIKDTVDANGNPIEISGLTVNEKQASASGIEMIFNQEDLNWERAGDLFTPASKDIKEYFYRSSVNKEIADRLQSKKLNPFEWELTVDEDPPELDPPMIVNAYLVLPVGETVKDVNKSLAIFWDEEEFFNLIKTNVIEDMKNPDGTSKMGAIPKYYTIKDSVIGTSGSDEIHPIDECHYEEVTKKDKDGQWYTDTVKVCSHYTFGFGFSDASTKPELLIPDFGLGFMIRKIQQKLRANFNQTYNYILSCQRIEDMFLGRCKGNPEGSPTQSFCSGEAFKNIKDLPRADGIPQFAKDVFTAEIAPKLTPDLIEAYEYAEKETGIPCEVVAGIHWTEAGLDPNGSVFSGAALTTSLKEDAKAAMEHLIKDSWPGNFDKNNIPYKDLVEAIGNYNGPGNMNCSSDQDNNPRDTRWREGNKCPAQFASEDHPHPVAWIDDRHTDMDLIYCMDFAEFNCQADATDSELQKIATRIREFMAASGNPGAWSEEKIASHLQEVKDHCFADSTKSNICQTLSDGRKYPKYERPGSITTAILTNEWGAGQ